MAVYNISEIRLFGRFLAEKGCVLSINGYFIHRNTIVTETFLPLQGFEPGSSGTTVQHSTNRAKRVNCWGLNPGPLAQQSSTLLIELKGLTLLARLVECRTVVPELTLLARLVECWTVVPEDPGSNPSRGRNVSVTFDAHVGTWVISGG